MINFHNYQVKISENSEFDYNIEPSFFSNALGFVPSENFIRNVEKSALRYRLLTHQEFEQHILNLLSYLFSEKEKSGPKRKLDWQEGWCQNLDEFQNNNYCLEALLPHYLRRGQNVMRFDGCFIIPEDPFFENKMRELILLAIFEKYMIDANDIYEFAAGPCHNIMTLAKSSQNKTFYALDWVDSSLDIMRIIGGKSHELGVSSHSFVAKKFDFFHPDKSFALKPGSVVFTFGGLEQVGEDFHRIMEYFLNQCDVRFVHLEPFVELYDRKNLFSETGYLYASNRNYLNGYFSELKKLQQQGKIDLEDEVRLLGSAFHDGWIFTSWKKIGS